MIQYESGIIGREDMTDHVHAPRNSRQDSDRILLIPHNLLTPHRVAWLRRRPHLMMFSSDGPAEQILSMVPCVNWIASSS